MADGGEGGQRHLQHAEEVGRQGLKVQGLGHAPWCMVAQEGQARAHTAPQYMRCPVLLSVSAGGSRPTSWGGTARRRRPARARPQHKALTHGTQTDEHASKDASSGDAHGNTASHSSPGASDGRVSKRLRVKERSIVANAAVTPADSRAVSIPDTQAEHDTPAAAAANAAHDGHDASTKSADHSANAAPAAKHGANAPAAPTPKKALAANDTHESNDTHAAPAAEHHEAGAAHATPAAHTADRAGSRT